MIVIEEVGRVEMAVVAVVTAEAVAKVMVAQSSGNGGVQKQKSPLETIFFRRRRPRSDDD